MTVPTEGCHRRAGGRRRYNADRQLAAEARRLQVLRLLRQWGLRRGIQARIANALDVSPATISRDVAQLLPLHRPCPCCDNPIPVERYLALQQEHRFEPWGGYEPT